MATEKRSMIMGLDGEFLPMTEPQKEILIEQEMSYNMETGEITSKYRRADKLLKIDAPDGMTKEEAFEAGFTIIEKWYFGSGVRGDGGTVTGVEGELFLGP